MDEIFISLKDCHGIKQLKQNFVFKKNSNNNKNTNLILIYAPNGTMKTSFAKTLRDLGDGVEPKNLVEYIRPRYQIKIKENEESFQLKDNSTIKDRIFVIESFKSDYSFNETAPLISDEELRKKYEFIFKEVINKKEDFLNKVKNKTDISIPRGKNKFSFIEKKIKKDLKYDSIDFLTLLKKIYENLDNFDYLDVKKIKYDVLFNNQVLKLLEDEEFINHVGSFSSNLDNLLSKSKIFNKDNFTYNNATDLLRNIKKNNLFEAGHYIKFKSKGKPIKNINDLEAIFEEQLHYIFEEEVIRKDFEKINKKFKNEKTKNLQRLISKDKTLITQLDDIDKLKHNYWYSIFNSLKEDLIILMEEYESKKNILSDIRETAKNEKTKWNEIIDMFNNRFHMPFKLELRNKEDVILNSEIPQVEFYYDNLKERVHIDLETLKNIGSAGQLKALYLLDILYKIEMKKKKSGITLLVFDDIADSFDYQNKYAIIEYLKDLSNDDSFRILLLTHNYDFFRTVKSRLNCDKSYFALKNEHAIIKLDNEHIESNRNNIFLDMVKKINQNPENHLSEIVALIPFIRNLSEYQQNMDNKDLLTKLLHYTYEGKMLYLTDLDLIYDAWNIMLPNDLDYNIYELIFKESDKLLNENPNKVNLKNKLILSMAIRLKAERFMFKKLRLDIKNFNKKSNQTRFLLDCYKEQYDDEIVNILEKVAMMTPENIHINSFMYEPILDMDDYYLRELYTEISELEK